MNALISTSFWSQEGIGNTTEGAYDVIIYSGFDLILNLTIGGTVSEKVGQVEFKVGDTGPGSVGLVETGFIATNITVNGVTKAINLPWTFTIGSNLDTIEVGISNKLSLDFGSQGILEVTLSGWGYPSSACAYCIVVRPILGTFTLRDPTPVIQSIGNKTVYPGETLEFKVLATDPFEYALTYSASNLPEEAIFDPSTQFFSWTPSAGQVGSYEGITFLVADNRNPPLSASEAITISVKDFDPALCRRAVDNYVWITVPLEDKVVRVNKTTLEKSEIGIGGYPHGVAVDDKYVWITQYYAGKITRITKDNISELREINVGPEPQSLCVDDKYVWVAMFGNSNSGVMRITKSDFSMVNISQNIGPKPSGCVTDRDYVYVNSPYQAQFSRINKSDLSTVAIPVKGSATDWTEIDDIFVYVTQANSQIVSRFRKSDLSYVDDILGLPQSFFVPTVDDDYIWIGHWRMDSTHSLTRVNKNDVTDQVMFYTGYRCVNVALDDEYAWVSHYEPGPTGEGHIARINRSNLEVTDIPICRSARTNSGGDFTGYKYDRYFYHPCPSNNAPVAQCRDISSSADLQCRGDASIDNGSYDPDGDPITFTQSPAGPYPLGNTIVTLTVIDSKGASSQCLGTVMVIDNSPPRIKAPDPLTRKTGPGEALCGVVISDEQLGIPEVSDNCPGVTYTRTGVPPGNIFPVGTTTGN